ncbi:MAG: YoaK family protein [Afipia sp.]|nr:YoaK family protein [Afipia sp.]
MLDSRANIALACLLSSLAGFVDAIGFIHLGGLFVSFMSGNSTRLGVSLQEGHWREALETVGLIALFVAGAGAGNLIVLGRASYRKTWVLLAEGLLLAGAALSHGFGFSALSIALIVFAMGLENAVFFTGGAGGLGLTYITGALVRVGQLMALALRGGKRWEWVPSFFQWASLVVGSVLGAFAYRLYNLDAIWFGAALALMLSAGLAFGARANAAAR